MMWYILSKKRQRQCLQHWQSNTQNACKIYQYIPTYLKSVCKLYLINISNIFQSKDKRSLCEALHLVTFITKSAAMETVVNDPRVTAGNWNCRNHFTKMREIYEAVAQLQSRKVPSTCLLHIICKHLYSRDNHSVIKG